MSLLTPPSPSTLRAELEALVIRDLLGPAGGPEEEVEERNLRDRYLVGKLAPRHQPVYAGESDELALSEEDTDEEGKADPSAVPADTLFPSSLGLSFTVAPEAESLRVTARWGWYRREKSETILTEKGNPKTVWRRYPIEGVLAPLPLKEGPIAPRVINPDQPEVVFQGRMLRNQDGHWYVSLFLVNGQTQGSPKDQFWLFQPELVVESVDGAPIFRKRRAQRDPRHQDPTRYAEDQAMHMLYRHQVEFAVGHGVAVRADLSADNPQEAVRLSTCAIPVYEVPQTTPPTAEDNPDLAGLTLDMQTLAELPKNELIAALRVLPTAYAQWVQRQRARIDDSGERLEEFREAASAALARCEETLARIRAGIDLLGANTMALQAFRFANRAMHLQRIHTLYAGARRADKPADWSTVDVPINRSWRMFQLAFILLNLPGIIDFDHPDRRPSPEASADLLWFPTGGGKTEAYLGLAAYVLGLRRLQGVVEGRRGDCGVAVLMRYTLRLLTLQQFQRAAALLCACEHIRREALAKGDLCWGQQPFRIGLWVGYRTTPNTTAASEAAVRALRGRDQGGAISSPAQLTSCPWCGSSIDPGQHIKVEPETAGRGRTLLYCGDPLGGCPFSEAKAPGEGLPVLVVDEEIYHYPPALLIATVDKFAQLPWKGETQMLFGQLNKYCPRHGFLSPEMEHPGSHPARPNLDAVRIIEHASLRPPDLIIQDELHLISGPLGSLVGLYETAIDQLCTWEVAGKQVRPKLIASTATIRQSHDQVYRLFMRRVAVFPPHGLDVSDNFFSLQRSPSEQAPGRRYLGIRAMGDRLKSTLIRVYITFLASAMAFYRKYGGAADPWMTLVGYFNSLRELGGMRRLVDDDIRSRLRSAEDRGLVNRFLSPPFVEELTSRKSASDIPKLLDWLEVGFDPANEQAREARGRGGRAQGEAALKKPLDVLLATNMISVGVDVRRLGLMVVAGQPKNTSEYIQATSRVGRSSPGLVCTIYNWARPRDLSHYERFGHYHATFYQHVEALSVTPFATGALDRGLAGILVALVRLLGAQFNANPRAQHIDGNHPIVRAAIEAIFERAVSIEGKPLGDEVRQMLQRKLDIWLREAQVQGRQLGYRSEGGHTVGLLKQAGIGRWQPFTALNSLRDVEPSVRLILEENAP